MKGSITKRGDKKYLIRFFRGVGKDGKQDRFAKTIHGTKKEAQKALRAYIKKFEDGIPIGRDSLSFETYTSKWLERCRRNGMTERTLSEYSENLSRYVFPAIGHIPVGSLRLTHLEDLYLGLQEKGLSAGSLRVIHSPVSRCLKQAVKRREIASNPASELELPKARKRAREATPFDPEQAKRFLSAAWETPFGPLFEVALATGMRPGEYLGLGWDCVLWATEEIRVERAVKRPRRSKPLLGPPKSKAGHRVIPVPTEVMKSLREHRKEQLEVQLDRGPDWNAENNLVFPDSEGQIWNESTFRKCVFDKVLKKAGLQGEGFTPYSLRHTCATLLLLAKEHPKVVSERLGHYVASSLCCELTEELRRPPSVVVSSGHHKTSNTTEEGRQTDFKGVQVLSSASGWKREAEHLQEALSL